MKDYNWKNALKQDIWFMYIIMFQTESAGQEIQI